jgi:hypothetical protein
VALADLDLDGDLDAGIASEDVEAGEAGFGCVREFALLENNGSGSVSDPWSTDQSYHVPNFDFAFVDLDGDACRDVFFAGCAGYRVFMNDCDEVPEAQDNCRHHPNEVVATPLSGRTYTSSGAGWQLDDDGDGIGNRCDCDYNNLGAVCVSGDFNDMKASVGKLLTTSSCGVSAAMNCKPFDHTQAGAVVTAEDFNIAKGMVGTLLNTVSCKNMTPACTQSCTGPACP